MELPYDGSQPVAPGTACGASTGDIVVTVVAGPISCDAALAVVKQYRALPPDPTAGNTNNRQFDEWQCMSPTAVMSEQLGYGTSCRNASTGAHLTTPLGAR